MATTPKLMYRGNAATSNTTLYTVGSGKTGIVTDIVVTNTDSVSATFTLNLNGTTLLSAATLAANSTATFELKQVLESADTVSGSASATTVKFHISGVEVI
jgi:hypothetical protein